MTKKGQIRFLTKELEFLNRQIRILERHNAHHLALYSTFLKYLPDDQRSELSVKLLELIGS